MRCPACISTDVARDGRFTVCYNCGCRELTDKFLENGDVIKRDDIGVYLCDDNIPDKNAGQVPTMDKGEKYRKIITGKAINTGAIKKYESVIVDVYDVLVAFKVTDPAVQHAIKKLLAMGQRGHKDKMTDLKEAHWQLERAMQLEENCE